MRPQSSQGALSNPHEFTVELSANNHSALSVDGQTIEDNTVTIRDRDTTEQERIKIDEALQVVRERLSKI